MEKAVEVVDAVKAMHAEYWPVLGTTAPSTGSDTEPVEVALAKLGLEEETEAAATEEDVTKKDSSKP
jgi:hypothetical protein